MRTMTGRFLCLPLSLLFLVLLAVPALSARCDDQGILHDVDHYVQSWGWGARSQKPLIHLWDSPDHVTVVGTINPGAHVVILEEREGYYRVRPGGGAPGWILKEQIASRLPKDPECP